VLETYVPDGRELGDGTTTVIGNTYDHQASTCDRLYM